MNLKDHLWKAANRNSDKSVDTERDKRLFKWAFDRIVSLESSLKEIEVLANERDGAEDDDTIIRVVQRTLKNGS